MTWAEIERLRTTGVITDRQAEILNYRRRGFSQRQIALGLGLSRATIRDHEAAAYRRIEANRTRPKETAA